MPIALRPAVTYLNLINLSLSNSIYLSKLSYLSKQLPLLSKSYLRIPYVIFSSEFWQFSFLPIGIFIAVSLLVADIMVVHILV